MTEEPHQPWDALSPFTSTADCPYFTRIFNWKYASRLADENLRYQIMLICVESPLLNLKRSPNPVSHVFCRWRRSWSKWWKRIRIRSFEARSKWRYGCSKKEGKIHTEVQRIISFFSSPGLKAITFRPSSVVRPSTFHILIFSSETTGPIATKTLVEWSLDGPLPKLCPVIPTFNQDSRQAKNRKKGVWNFNCPLLL